MLRYQKSRDCWRRYNLAFTTKISRETSSRNVPNNFCRAISTSSLALETIIIDKQVSTFIPVGENHIKIFVIVPAAWSYPLVQIMHIETIRSAHILGVVRSPPPRLRVQLTLKFLLQNGAQWRQSQLCQASPCHLHKSSWHACPNGWGTVLCFCLEVDAAGIKTGSYWKLLQE